MSVTPVYRTYDQGDAALVMSLLDAESIPNTLVSNQGAGNYLPPTVCVLRDSDLPRAKAIVEEYEHTKDASSGSGSKWKCVRCGETIGSTFTECWRCGADRT
ncbi:MAG: DUF2007 domain-containing protein [Nitrospirota bacterium]